MSEGFIARQLFKLRVHEYDGNAFQDFFVKIAGLHDKRFRPVKPQGNKGDRKNDGFIQEEGIYYQVYAPEEIRRISPRDIIEKIDEDFNGLVAFWAPIAPIKEYFFVINDKYRGTYPDVEKCLASKTTDTCSCKPFLAKDLENYFIQLSDSDKEDVIGHLPSAESIEFLPYDIMDEVVRHLLSGSRRHTQEESFPEIDFNRKIAFNKLNPHVAALLTVASYQSSEVEGYFSLNSEFPKVKLQEKFSELYEEGKNKFDDPNTVFFFILDKASPTHEKNIQDCVLGLMAYYFESCDIFEEVIVDVDAA